jgi:hypothetical protein
MKRGRKEMNGLKGLRRARGVLCWARSYMEGAADLFWGKLVAAILIGMSFSMAWAVERVQYGQDIEIRGGWNAVYLMVSPQMTADELFGSWPVNFVAAYDPSAFLETKQYSIEGSTEGALKGGYRMWQRGDAGATSITRLTGNTVYLFYATNRMSKVATVRVYGVPVAPRMTWHVSEQSGEYDGLKNLIGVSVGNEATTTIGSYFDGLDVGEVEFRKLYGTDVNKPSQAVYPKNTGLSAGSALVVSAKKVSDWSGVLNVSPMSGIDFGTNGTMGVVTVRNDGTVARTVRVELEKGFESNALASPPVPMGLMIKDTSTVLGSSGWTNFTDGVGYEKTLAAGETMRLSLAVDRTAYTDGTKGTYYGGLLVVKDVDGGSNMRVVVPVELTSAGDASGETAWPKGIWILTAELKTVSFVGAERLEVKKDELEDKDTGETYTHVYTNKVNGISDVAAGGKMKVRLPMAVDREGNMCLVQRMWYGHDTNGVLHVIEGSNESAVPLYSPRRISTVFLPTDQVRIGAESGGKFGATVRFPFVVGERSNVNPMRHSLHPQHDGYQFDFETPSPSGDDLQNYIGTIKPEVFSITNVVNLMWTEGEGGTAWSPEETLTGELIWEFGGLRHEGTVHARGPFTMKRISAASLEKGKAAGK